MACGAPCSRISAASSTRAACRALLAEDEAEELEGEAAAASGILLAATTAPLALCTHRATVAVPPEPRELRGSYSSSKRRDRDSRSMESAAWIFCLFFVGERGRG